MGGVSSSQLAMTLGVDRGCMAINDAVDSLLKQGLPLSRADLYLVVRSWAAATSPRPCSQGSPELSEDDCVDGAQVVTRYCDWLMARTSARPIKEMPSCDDAGGLQSVSRCLDGSLALHAAKYSTTDQSAHALPVEAMFAFLDEDMRGHVPIATIELFTERCLDLSTTRVCRSGASTGDGTAEGIGSDCRVGAGRAAEVCDVAGWGVVAFRDFRRFVSCVDRQRMPHLSPASLAELEARRVRISELLSAVAGVDACAGDAGDDGSARSRVVSAALLRRGQLVDGTADAQGLAQLVRDLMDHNALDNDYEDAAAAFLTAAASCVEARGSEVRPMTYRRILGAARYSRLLSLRCLEGLVGPCLWAGVDPAAAIAFEDPGNTSKRIDGDELVSALQSAGVNLSPSKALSGALRALDPSGQQGVLVPAVARRCAELRARHGAVLRELSARLDVPASDDERSPDGLACVLAAARSPQGRVFRDLSSRNTA